MSEKIRLGGMALANGVLVHGPTAWACAVRLPDGTLRVESAPKRFRSADVSSPLLRGPAKLAEVFMLLPEIRRRIPDARLPFERPRVLTAMVASTALATRAPVHLRSAARGAATLGAVAASTEIFNWMVRNPDHRLSKALAKPGHELQHRLATSEPSLAQLEVAEAALTACLALEDGGGRDPA